MHVCENINNIHIYSKYQWHADKEFLEQSQSKLAVTIEEILTIVYYDYCDTTGIVIVVILLRYYCDTVAIYSCDTIVIVVILLQ